MQLNQIKPNKKAVNNIKRLGRGMGSGKGKTCGKGHKGQKARSGYKKKLHFEGGQMPKQRRLPKKGFTSRKQMYTKTIRLSELNKIDKQEINLNCLMESKLVTKKYRYVKVISKGEIKKDINLKGINITKGAKLQIEENGGKIT
jgi:large subunit ribosomal protein L15